MDRLADESATTGEMFRGFLRRHEAVIIFHVDTDAPRVSLRKFARDGGSVTTTARTKPLLTRRDKSQDKPIIHERIEDEMIFVTRRPLRSKT